MNIKEHLADIGWAYAVIILIVILLSLASCSSEPDDCAESIYEEAMRYAELLPKGMNVSDALTMAEDYKVKGIIRLSFAMRMYC